MKISIELARQEKPITGRALIPAVALPGHAKILRTLSRNKVMRMYDAAISNNLNADFPVSITSANAEILTSISNTRSRGRTVERDNPYGAGIIRIYQNNVVGWDPFPLEMKVGKWVKTPDGKGETFEPEIETNRKIEEFWQDLGKVENCTVRRDMSRLEVYLQAISAIVRDGGWLLRHHDAFPNNVYNYAVEPIEYDRLDQYYNRPKNGANNEIQFSIEMDDWHGPIRYWILTRHPGDVYVSWSGAPQYREPVPAKDITAIFDIRTRAGQYVGMSRLASVIQSMHRLEQFDLAHVTAAIWASCKPFFITQEFPTALGEYVPDYIKKAIESGMDDGIGEGEGDKISNVEPGTGEVLPYGQKPVLVDPKFPIEAASEFKKDQLRKMATGSGVPYFILAQDWGAINFSSGRLGLDDFHDTCRVLSGHIIEGLVRPWFNRSLRAAILSGRLDLPFTRLEEFQRAANFAGRSYPYVQPLQDAQADKMLIDMGVTSRDAVIRERGGRGVEEVDAQIASDRRCDEAHGLDFVAPDMKPAPEPEGDAGAEDDLEPKPMNGNGKRFILT